MAIHHVRRGSGPPLVLVPGTASSWRAWAPVLDRLAAARDVVAVDLPGFGGSDPLGGVRPDPPALAAAVAGLLDELGLERPHVAGSSLGGAVALELGRLGRAASVCAVSPIGLWTAREAAFCAGSLRGGLGLAERFPGPVARLVRTRVGRTLLLGQVIARPWRVPADEADALVATPRPGFEAIVDAYVDYRVTFRPPCPVTVAWGTRDRLLLPRQARRVARVMPDARLVWLRGLGHVPTWDDPPAVASLLLDASA